METGLFFFLIDLAWLGALNMEVLNPSRRAVATALKFFPFATRIWRHKVETQHVTPGKRRTTRNKALWSDQPTYFKYL